MNEIIKSSHRKHVRTKTVLSLREEACCYPHRLYLGRSPGCINCWRFIFGDTFKHIYFYVFIYFFCFASFLLTAVDEREDNLPLPSPPLLSTDPRNSALRSQLSDQMSCLRDKQSGLVMTYKREMWLAVWSRDRPPESRTPAQILAGEPAMTTTCCNYH